MGKFQSKQPQSLGGSRATLFVFAMGALDTMAFISNAFLLTLFGGFISDSYFSRFKTCVAFGCLEIVGYLILATQAHLTHLRPQPCKGMNMDQHCEAATTAQQAILFSGLYLVALGTGGVKAALPSLGADQFDDRDPEEAASLSSYFNWLMFSYTLGAIIGVTFLVWISSNLGWDWAFGICAMIVAMGIFCLAIGHSTYRTNVPKRSALIGIIQVFVVAVRNRKLRASEGHEMHEIHDKETGHDETLQRTDQFKFLDRAAMKRNSEDPSGSWKLCTVTQVEEAKILVRMLPIILSTVFMNTCLAQLQTFSIQQSTTMTRKIGSFEMPGPSIPVIPLLFMFILIPIYDRFFVPVARKITGIPTGITTLQRVAVGLVLSTLSMAISGVVETHRKKVAINHGLVDSTDPLPMSVFWLGIQYGIFGIADMFTLVGLLEFFYAESSSGMKSLGTAISWCSLAFGYYTSSVVVNVVNKASGGWLSSNNLNRDRLEYFYWLLAGMSVVNFAVYLLCASWYKYKRVEEKSEDCIEKKIDVSIGKNTSVEG
ncbi:protein NRT1/ PTR FAMILY 4.5-like isoform X2 [Andrographis paniculata]|uniref:protein NRT1/ PTR FAMILY 4.5-like isoform X2 n=1 Tax=Andrographis paniculata TaxID=175694 RepID=UPI0021E84728|nr:protein NRT1/ PTR FAMILY 4.5-like isoform X2 [Andrographis paniculata]